MSSKESVSDLIEIEKQDAAQAGGIGEDSRFIWLMIAIPIAFIAFLALYGLGHGWSGGIIALLLIMLIVICSWPWFDDGDLSIFGKAYRRVGYRHRRKLDIHYWVSRRIARGERADGETMNIFSEFPELFGNIEAVAVPYPDQPGEVWGAIRDRDGPNRSYSAGVRAVGTRPLFDDVYEPVDRRLAFANLLNLTSRSGIDMLAWEDVTAKGEDLQAPETVQRLRQQSGLDQSTAESDAELIEFYRRLERESYTHRTTFTLSIMEGRKRSKEIQAMGGWERVLYDRLDRFTKLAAADGVGIDQRAILDFNDLVIASRRVWDPEFAKLMEMWLPAHPDDQLDGEMIWPDTHDFDDPECWRGDGCWHVALYLSNFSSSMFASKHWRDMVRTKVEKTVKVVCRNIPVREVVKNAERNTTNAVRQVTDRPAGRRMTEVERAHIDKRQKQERRAVRSSHFEMSLRVYIDVRGKNKEEAMANAAEVISACDGAGFVVLPMPYIQHLNASAMLYAARGLSGKHGNKE